MQFDLIALNCRYSHSCLSLFYLQTALQTKIPDCHIRIRQFTINETYYDILLHLTELDTEIIFFSVYIWNSRMIGRLIKDLTLVKPNLPIILGGPQAPTLSEEETSNKWTTVKGPVEGLPQSFYDDLQTGKLSEFYLAKDYPDFPYPYTDKDLLIELVNRNVYYESSRGCPFSCSYCLSSSGKRVRSKEIEVVEKELDHILAHQPRVIRFVDRTFNYSTARSLAIWRYLEKKKGETTFHFEIAPDLFTEEIFSFLEEIPPGKFQFEIGIQSTNPATLKAINRTSSTQKSLTAIDRLAARDNIHLHVDLILGLPFDDMEAFRKSFNQIFHSSAHYIQMGLLKVLPDSPIREEAKKFNLKFCQSPPYQILSTQWLTHRELSRLYWFGQCVEAFYNNHYFPAFFGYIKKREEGFQFFSELLDLCLTDNFFRLAKTQEFMTRLLLKIGEQRADHQIIKELLCYDWLRTGKRFLPPFLADIDLQAEKKKLRKTLPDEKPPLYTKKSRNSFFKKSIFVPFSDQTLKELSFRKDGKRVICFLPEQEASVRRLQKTVLL